MKRRINKKWTFPVRQSKPEKRALVAIEFRPKSTAPDYLKRAREFAYQHSTVRNHEAFTLGVLLGYLRKKDAEIAKLKANR